MSGEGRESREASVIFFLCSLIEYIARRTCNRRNAVVQRLGSGNLAKILDLADIYHSDNIERVAGDFIDECAIANGSFDNVKVCRYRVPSFWDMGKVYKRLVVGLMNHEGIDAVAAVERVYSSFLSDKIDDYNTGVYYDPPQQQLSDLLSAELTAEM